MQLIDTLTSACALYSLLSLVPFLVHDASLHHQSPQTDHQMALHPQRSDWRCHQLLSQYLLPAKKCHITQQFLLITRHIYNNITTIFTYSMEFISLVFYNIYLFLALYGQTIIWLIFSADHKTTSKTYGKTQSEWVWHIKCLLTKIA